jgi:hypothetical protein
MCLFCSKFNNIALNLNSVMSIGDWGAKTTYSEWCYLISKWRVFIFVLRRTENTNANCEKTAVLRSGNFSDLNSACSKMLVTVKIFQFHDMLNESERYRVTANGLYEHSINKFFCKKTYISVFWKLSCRYCLRAKCFIVAYSIKFVNCSV